MCKHRRASFAAVLLFPASLVAQNSPPPRVTGPIPVTATPGDSSHNYPFFSTVQWLAPFDYMEEEFYIEGSAPLITLAADNTATVDAGSPYAYKTRVIVRRPKSSRAFNGTVILEWPNSSAGNDFEVDWTWSHEHLMRRGFVHVGVTLVPRGTEGPNGLRNWNPTRYGSLDVSAGGKVVGPAGPRLDFGILSDVARAIKKPSGTSLVGDLKVRNIVATGHAGAAQSLGRYYNVIHPLHGVVDGFVIHSPLNASPFNVLRTDLRTPVWKLLSESDVLAGQALVRQPDTPFLRTWEVAGTSHGDFEVNETRLTLWARDLPGVSTALEQCTPPILSHVPSSLVQAAVYDHMKQWVETGKQPPSAPPITLTSIGKFGTPEETRSVAARDEHGIALGGIRLADVDVPTATNSGWNEGCRNTRGSYAPFDSAKLARLYSSRARYLAEVNRVTDANLRAGYITKEGAAQTKKNAAVQFDLKMRSSSPTRRSSAEKRAVPSSGSN